MGRRPVWGYQQEMDFLGPILSPKPEDMVRTLLPLLRVCVEGVLSLVPTSGLAILGLTSQPQAGSPAHW